MTMLETRPKPASVPVTSAPEEKDKFYSTVREGANSLSINIRLGTLQNGCFYIDLRRVILHPDQGILMVFNQLHVWIQGRNLQALYDNLLRQRVDWIRIKRQEETVDEKELCIENISFPASDGLQKLYKEFGLLEDA